MIFLKIVGLILRFCDLYGRGIFWDCAISALPWHYVYYKEKNVYIFLFSLFIFTNIWHLSLENTKRWFVSRTTDNHISRHICNYLTRNKLFSINFKEEGYLDFMSNSLWTQLVIQSITCTLVKRVGVSLISFGRKILLKDV